MSERKIESFVQRLEAPVSAPFETISRALGHGVLRWAVVGVERNEWIVEGARLAPCSTSST